MKHESTESKKKEMAEKSKKSTLNTKAARETAKGESAEKKHLMAKKMK